MIDLIVKLQINMYDKYIDNARDIISNEHILESQYNGEGHNPHTENIKQLESCIKNAYNEILKIRLNITKS